MPTPAERIFDAAAAALAGQQSRANQITTGIAPLGAGAVASALLLKPALHDIAHAQILQIVGLAAGVLGLAAVLLAGSMGLFGVDVKGVEPAVLTEVAARPGLFDDENEFDLQAAVSLGEVRRENRKVLRWLRIIFRVVVAGFVAELVGLGGAALIQPRPKPPPARPAELQMTHADLGGGSLTLAGRLASGAHGRVLVVLRLSGRTGQLTSLTAAIHGGRFRLRVRVPHTTAPLRSASYTIIWAGSRSVQRAKLAGSISRCPEDCY